MTREQTRVIRIGERVIGGGNPVLIQSMTNTRTEDVEATVAQIHALEKAGCEIIRCTVPASEAAKAVGEIKKRISIPLVADIHFDYRMAIAAMLRQELFKAQRYYEKKCAGMKRSEEDFHYEAWVPVFEGKIPLKAHVHRADDIQTAIRIAKEYGLSMTLDHCSEGHLIAEKVKESGFPAVVGPDLASRSKIEVQNMAFKTVGILNRAD